MYLLPSKFKIIYQCKNVIKTTDLLNLQCRCVQKTAIKLAAFGMLPLTLG